MNKRTTAIAIVLIIAVFLGSMWIGYNVSRQNQNNDNVAHYTYKILNTYPHDTAAFTEGLVYDQGSLYESTGEYGKSSLRRVNLETGEVTKEIKLPAAYYGEGLALVNGSLIQLTWREHTGFVYDAATFELQRNFSYATDGWGLTYDGERLIMSDGSATLYFLDPVTYQETGTLTVHDGQNDVINLNELEYINGTIYANIWLTNQIALINPQTGQIKGILDLSGLYQSNDINAVLNGIAYDPQNNQLYVTGKNWPNLYQIEPEPQN
ncbi:MAG: glutaminyl-peptide cyclotransferase [Candidatus Bathyarchaeota archaeon]|nr:glutaminyl-peptide cyclotransferase [Candidatus Bathyarchaeota archaeon]